MDLMHFVKTRTASLLTELDSKYDMVIFQNRKLNVIKIIFDALRTNGKQY